jgi:hypothetical protein
VKNSSRELFAPLFRFAPKLISADELFIACINAAISVVLCDAIPAHYTKSFSCLSASAFMHLRQLIGDQRRHLPSRDTNCWWPSHGWRRTADRRLARLKREERERGKRKLITESKLFEFFLEWMRNLLRKYLPPPQVRAFSAKRFNSETVLGSKTIEGFLEGGIQESILRCVSDGGGNEMT